METVINRPSGEAAKYSYLNLAEPELSRRVERVLRELTAATARPSVDAFLHRALKVVPLETFIPRIRQREVAARVPQAQQEFLRALAESVASRQKMSISEAKAFVDRMVGTRQVDTLCVALFTLRTEQAQGLAAAGLASLRDPRGVPALVIRLGQAAGLWLGGSEAEHQRKELRRALAAALGTLSGLNVSKYLASPAVLFLGAKGTPSDGESDSLDLIAQVHAWLKTHESERNGGRVA